MNQVIEILIQYGLATKHDDERTSPVGVDVGRGFPKPAHEIRIIAIISQEVPS